MMTGQSWARSTAGVTIKRLPSGGAMRVVAEDDL